MKVRLWNRKTDYEVIAKWWEGHKVPENTVPNHRLPPSGWIVEDDEGNPLCITWLYYFQHVPGALVGNVVSNPEGGKKEISKAFDLLFLRITSEADRNNVDMLFGMSTREGMVRKLKKFGFEKSTEHSVEFQRELGGSYE